MLLTFYFVYQHIAFQSWDFSAYVLNAKYLFYGGTYFETLRPPLAAVLLGLFLFLSKYGEFLYIICVSIFFLFTTKKLSEAIYENLKPKIIDKHQFMFLFYFFSIGGFTLVYGLKEGSELLSLALFELFLWAFIKNRNSGIYIGLAFLTRYNYMIFIPFLFINKNYKKVIKNIAIFLIIISPWLIFNYLKFGNFFASILDAHYNNIGMRGYIYTPFNILSLLEVMGLFLPFCIVGLIDAITSLVKRKKDEFNKNKISILFGIIAVITIFLYIKIPLKDLRYLFTLILPISYFSVIGIKLMFERLKLNKKSITLILLALMLLFMFTFNIIAIKTDAYTPKENKYYNAAKDIERLGIENCEILSPHWVLVTYYTENVYPLGGASLDYGIKANKITLIFKNEATLDDRFDLNKISKQNILYESADYIFVSKENFSIERCSKKYTYDSTYLKDYCEKLSSSFRSYNKTALNICKYINKR